MTDVNVTRNPSPEPLLIAEIKRGLDIGFPNGGATDRLLGYYFDDTGLVALINPSTLKVLVDLYVTVSRHRNEVGTQMGRRKPRPEDRPRFC